MTTNETALDERVCHRALRAKDPRFDGLFFVGVSTTGIYCRPICPARTPRAEHCAYFVHAAVAEREGYRACLRCRPELAPGAAPTEARSRLVTAALVQIERGALAHAGVEALATSLQVTSRHLRRSVEAELGATLKELEETRRLALGKQLLSDTGLPVARVAFASGFRSVRRFNAVFASRFGRSPSSLRRGTPRDGAAVAPPIALRLAFRPPLAYRALLAFLARRAVPGVERVEGGVYERAVVLGASSGSLRVRSLGSELEVAVSPGLLPELPRIVRAVRDLFDLDASPGAIAETLSGDARLAAQLGSAPGLRVPGAFDPFEIAVRAVLAQQISVAGATTLSGRIALRFGRRLEGLPPGLERVSPTATELAAVSVRDLRAVGMPESRARTLASLARAVASGEIDLESRGDVSGVVERLREIAGIGPFTAQVIAMRVLRDPDAFPETDLFVMRRLGRDPVRAAERWRPFRAYGVMYLWEREGIER